MTGVPPSPRWQTFTWQCQRPKESGEHPGAVAKRRGPHHLDTSATTNRNDTAAPRTPQGSGLLAAVRSTHRPPCSADETVLVVSPGRVAICLCPTHVLSDRWQRFPISPSLCCRARLNRVRANPASSSWRSTPHRCRRGQPAPVAGLDKCAARNCSVIRYLQAPSHAERQSGTIPTVASSAGMFCMRYWPSRIIASRRRPTAFRFRQERSGQLLLALTQCRIRVVPKCSRHVIRKNVT